MQQVIEKAIEGGWKQASNGTLRTFSLTEDGVRLNGADYYSKEEIVCDPLFWQALGKSCGWAPEKVMAGHQTMEGFKADAIRRAEWVGKALTFHEINLIKGWDRAVSYLSSLIKE